MSIVALGSAENRVSLYYEEMATKGNGLNVRQDVLRVRTTTILGVKTYVIDLDCSQRLLTPPTVRLGRRVEAAKTPGTRV